jgi:hypothetical protein
MLIDFFTFFTIYLISGVMIVVVFAKTSKSTQLEVQIFLLALLFKATCTFYYYVFTTTNPADALGYYQYAARVEFLPSIGLLFQTSTGFVNNVAALFFPLVSSFTNQYLMLYIPFSLLGFIGSLLFYRAMRAVAPFKRKRDLFLVCFFLPNMVFWTSNLGKDSLMFLGIAMVLYGFLAKVKTPRNIVFIGLGGLLVYAVRPHTFLFMTFGFLLGMAFERRKMSPRLVIGFVLAAAALMFTFQRTMTFAGVTVEDDEEHSSSVGSYYEAGISRVETSSQDLKAVGGGAAMGGSHKFSILYSPYYLAMFLGSPFLWQARKPIHVFSALETLIYQIMILYICIHWRAVVRIRFIPFKYSWITYLILSSIIEGAAQTNFGLIIRQRCMVLPVVFLFFLGVRYYLSVNNTRKPQLVVGKPPTSKPLYAAKTKD